MPARERYPVTLGKLWMHACPETHLPPPPPPNPRHHHTPIWTYLVLHLSLFFSSGCSACFEEISLTHGRISLVFPLVFPSEISPGFAALVPPRFVSLSSLGAGCFLCVSYWRWFWISCLRAPALRSCSWGTWEAHFNRLTIASETLGLVSRQSSGIALLA